MVNTLKKFGKDQIVLANKAEHKAVMNEVAKLQMVIARRDNTIADLKEKIKDLQFRDSWQIKNETLLKIARLPANISTRNAEEILRVLFPRAVSATYITVIRDCYVDVLMERQRKQFGLWGESVGKRCAKKVGVPIKQLALSNGSESLVSVGKQCGKAEGKLGATPNGRGISISGGNSDETASGSSIFSASDTWVGNGSFIFRDTNVGGESFSSSSAGSFGGSAIGSPNDAAAIVAFGRDVPESEVPVPDPWITLLVRSATDETEMPLRNSTTKKTSTQLEVSRATMFAGDGEDDPEVPFLHSSPGLHSLSASSPKLMFRELLSELQALSTKHASVLGESLLKTEAFVSIKLFLKALCQTVIRLDDEAPEEDHRHEDDFGLVSAGPGPGHSESDVTTVNVAWVHSLDRASSNLAALPIVWAALKKLVKRYDERLSTCRFIPIRLQPAMLASFCITHDGGNVCCKCSDFTLE